MQVAMVLLLLAAAFVLTIPFGIWRAHTRKFSVAWFAAIHLPIPAIFLVRTGLGIGWILVPFVIIASIAGQMVGARIFPPTNARLPLKKASQSAET